MTLFDLDAERAVLGACLLTGDAGVVGHLVGRGLRPEHFYWDQHRQAFAAMVSLAERGSGVDLLTVSAEIDRLGRTADSLDRAAIDELTGCVPALGNYPDYADRLIKVAEPRLMRQAAERAAETLRAASLRVPFDPDAFDRARSLLDAGTPAGGDTLRLLTGDDLLALEPPSWLIAGLLPDYGQVNIYGKPESFKSFLALDWALSIAEGTPWLGRPVKAGCVVYVAGEGARGLRDRYAAWLTAHGLERVKRIRFLAEAVDLLDTKTVDRVKATLARLPEPPRLLVVDTMARAMPGGDENSARDVGAFIGALDRLVPASLTVHHTRREDDEERGSGALRGGANMMCRMRREEHSLRAVLSCQKMRDAQRWPDLRLVLRPAGPSLAVAQDVVKPDQLQDRIVTALLDRGPLSLNALVPLIGKRRADVAAALRDLASKNVIEKVKDSWQVVPDSSEPPGTTPRSEGPGVVPQGTSPVGGSLGTTPAQRYPEPVGVGTTRNGGPPTLLEAACPEDAVVELIKRDFDATELDEDAP